MKVPPPIVIVSSYRVDLRALPLWITIVYDDNKKTWMRQPNGQWRGE